MEDILLQKKQYSRRRETARLRVLPWHSGYVHVHNFPAKSRSIGYSSVFWAHVEIYTSPISSNIGQSTWHHCSTTHR